MKFMMIRARRVLSAMAATFLFATGASAAEPAAPPPATQTAILIHKIAGPLTIDGDLSKPQWKAVEPLRVDYLFNKKGVLSETPRMTVRYLWDDHYFYIGYEFYSKNLKAQGTGKKEGPEGNEREGAEISVEGKKVNVAEFFISFNDPHFFWEIHLNELNQFNDVWCTVVDPAWKVAQQAQFPYGIIFSQREFIADQGPYKLKTAVKMMPKADGKPSTVNDPSDVDTGYTAEIRIPWLGLGAAKSRKTMIQVPPEKKGDRLKMIPGPWKMVGEQMSILAVYQDEDLPDRYHHSSPLRPPGGFFHQSEPFWQVFELVDK
jgi:hypothetical protein